MIPTDFQLLFSRPERPQRAVLSVYLNTGHSQDSRRHRGFEKQLKSMISPVRRTIHDAAEMERFVSATQRLEDFVSAYEPRGRGLVMLLDTIDGFFWRKELDIPLHSQAHWDRELFLQPLANILDQFEPYGVVLIDPNRLRLFTVVLDEIEEVRLAEFGPAAHWERVIKEIDQFVQGKHVQRLILAGEPEVTSELRGRLTKPLALLIIGVTNLQTAASAGDILQATHALAEEYERSTEMETVKEVLSGAKEGTRAVVGLPGTLRASMRTASGN